MLENLLPLLPLVLALLATGAAAGFLAGLLGVGGGIIVVPILFSVLNILDIDRSVSMHIAVGTSLATIIPTSIASVASHNRKGAVDWRLFISWLPWLVIGVVIGTWFANTQFDGEILTTVFACVALIVAIDLTIRHREIEAGAGQETKALSWLYQARAGPIPTIIGTFSALMGIGGGTLSVPFLSAFSYPTHRAVATSAGFGLIISVPAALGYLIGGWDTPARPSGSVGYINVYGFVLITLMTVFLAPVGARASHVLKARTLRLLFAGFLTATALRMFLAG